jgi:hypothetical protein
MRRHLIIKGEDYAFALPPLIAHKQRKLELRAGALSARGRKGPAARYSFAAVRAAKRDLTTRGEAAHRTMVAAWPQLGADVRGVLLIRSWRLRCLLRE